MSLCVCLPAQAAGYSRSFPSPLLKNVTSVADTELLLLLCASYSQSDVKSSSFSLTVFDSQCGMGYKSNL